MTEIQYGRPHGRELTGRAVLLWLLAFFTIVFGVNAVMIRAATTTFGGLETESSYKAGLAFKQDIAAAQEQDARHWQVDGKITRSMSGEVSLEITAHDSNGLAIPAWTASARLAHPADTRLDRPVEMMRVGTDKARGTVLADPGQWDVVINLDRNGARMFQSRSRVTLR